MAVAVAVTIAAHAPSWNAGLVDFDDQALLVENTRHLGLSSEHLAWMFTTTHMGHYQPLTWLSYAIDYDLLGGSSATAEPPSTEFPARLDPRVFHRTNLVLHACNVLLVMILVRWLIRLGHQRVAGAIEPRDHALHGRMAPWVIAGLAAAFWGAHPLRVESVAWATERRDVLSTFFLLASTLAYLRSVPGGALSEAANYRDRAHRAWLHGSLLLLSLSLLSKAWGMSLFVLLILLDVYPLRRLPIDPWKWLTRERIGVLLEKAPSALMGIAAAIVAGLAQKSAPGAVRSLAEWPLTSRIAQAAYGLVFYLKKTIAPTDLVALVELPREMHWLAPRYLASYAVVAIVAATAVAFRKRLPGLSVACAAYFVLLLPVLGTLQSGDQFVADRYSYLAIIPIIILVAGGASRVSAHKNTVWRWALLVLACGAIAVCIPLSREQTHVWADSVSLWSHAVQHGAPGSAVHVNLGIALQQKSRASASEEAAAQFQRATQIDPSDGRAWYRLGRELVAQKKYGDAEHALRQAAQHMPQAYIAWVALGNMLFHERERREEGIAAFREGVRDLTTPRAGSDATRKLSGLPYLSLGTALKKMGDFGGARAAFEGALAYPDSADQARLQLAALPAAR